MSSHWASENVEPLPLRSAPELGLPFLLRLGCFLLRRGGHRGQKATVHFILWTGTYSPAHLVSPNLEYLDLSDVSERPFPRQAPECARVPGHPCAPANRRLTGFHNIEIEIAPFTHLRLHTRNEICAEGQVS